jgi:hypothetical protein
MIEQWLPTLTVLSDMDKILLPPGKRKPYVSQRSDFETCFQRGGRTLNEINEVRNILSTLGFPFEIGTKILDFGEFWLMESSKRLVTCYKSCMYPVEPIEHVSSLGNSYASLYMSTG